MSKMISKVFYRRLVLGVSSAGFSVVMVLLVLHVRSHEIFEKDPVAVFDSSSQTLKLTQTTDLTNVEFNFFNPGTSPLKILSTESSCGCSSVKASHQIIPPQSQSSIVVGVTPFEAGERLVHINIRTNSRIQELVTLTLKIFGPKSAPFLISKAAPINFGLDPYHTINYSITTQERRKSINWLGEAKSENLDLNTILASTSRVNKSEDDDLVTYNYLVKLNRIPPIGSFDGELRFFSSDNLRSLVVAVPVYGIVRSAVYAAPELIYRSLSRAELGVKKIPISIKSDLPDHHLEISPPPNTDEYEIVWAYNSKGITNFFLLVKKIKGGILNTNLTFKTNSEIVKEVNVKIYIKAN